MTFVSRLDAFFLRPPPSPHPTTLLVLPGEQEHFPASRITYLLPGESTVLSSGERAVEIKATSGAVLGPPWQQAENGFIVRPAAAEESEKGGCTHSVLERTVSRVCVTALYLFPLRCVARSSRVCLFLLVSRERGSRHVCLFVCVLVQEAILAGVFLEGFCMDVRQTKPAFCCLFCHLCCTHDTRVEQTRPVYYGRKFHRPWRPPNQCPRLLILCCFLPAAPEGGSLYFEPHLMFDEAELSKLHADVVIAPVVSQSVGPYPLVNGG